MLLCGTRGFLYIKQLCIYMYNMFTGMYKDVDSGHNA